MFNSKKTGELIVKQRYAPRTKIIIAGVIGTVLIVAVAATYNYGLSVAGFKRLMANRAQESLELQIKEYKKENHQLRGALARAERTLQMDQAAYSELDSSLKESAKQIVRLREELNFYRNIISPPNKKSGLRIQSLNIEPTTTSNHFRYKLVLIQALKHDNTISGNAEFEVSGMQAGKNAVLKFPTKSKAIAVRFKYFQDVEGKLELPRNFEPLKIKISVRTSGRVKQTVEQTYNWPKFEGKA